MVISLEITEVAWPGVGHRGTALVEEVSEHSTAGNTLADPLLQGALQFVATATRGNRVSWVRRSFTVRVWQSSRGSGTADVRSRMSGTADGA